MLPDESKAHIERVFIDTLNEAFKASPEAIGELFDHREVCSPELADHPTVAVTSIVQEDLEICQVGSMGIINGILGKLTDHKACMVVDELTGDMLGFKMLDGPLASWDPDAADTERPIIRYIKEDAWGRRLFKTASGNILVDVDGILHTTTDEGEPLGSTGYKSPPRNAGEFVLLDESDAWGRGLYVNHEGEILVDVDGHLHSRDSRGLPVEAVGIPTPSDPD